MKKHISFILVLVMLVSLLPATFTSASAAEGDIVFDFAAWVKSHTEVARHTEMTAEHMENIAPNKTGTAQTSGFLWETATNPKSMRLANVIADWERSARSGGNGQNNKLAFDITVSASEEGWYSPEFSVLANAMTDTLSVYMIHGGEATYLGDMSPSSKKINAVYLKEGTNTLVLCCVSAVGSSTTFYMDKITFIALESEPTATLRADMPAELGLGASAENLKADLQMSDGTIYQFPSHAINATSFQSAGADTASYLKVESEDTSIATVTYKKSSSVESRTTTTFAIEAKGAGETNIVFTPVINGVEQTEKATKKPFKVLQDEITAITLSASESEVYVGGKISLSLTASWESSPDTALSAEDVTFESLNDYATVDADGTVTGVAEGTAKIRATLKENAEVGDTIEITIAPAPAQRDHEYIFSKSALNVDKMISNDTTFQTAPVIRARNGAIYFMKMLDWNYEVAAEYSATGEPFMSLDTTTSDGDARLTDKWAFASSWVTLGGPYVDPNRLVQEFTTASYSKPNPNYVALKLYVESAGDYELLAKSSAVAQGVAAATYFFPTSASGVILGAAHTYPENSKLGYFEMAKASDYTKIGNITAPSAGEYYVIFQADTTSLTLNPTVVASNNCQYFDLAAIKLRVPEKDVLTAIELSASATSLEEGDTANLSAKAIWSVSGEKVLDIEDVTLTVSPEGVVELSSDGIVTAVGGGSATVTATLKADTSKTSSVTFSVIEDEIEEISLTSSKSTIYVDDTASLSAKVTWSVSGEKVLDMADVTLTTSNDNVSVSADGTITGLAAGSSTITATLKTDGTKVASVSVTVTEKPVATTKEYVTTLSAFNKASMKEDATFLTTPTLRPTHGFLYFRPAMSWKYEVPAEYSATGEAFMAMDSSKTAPWAYEDAFIAIGNPVLYDDKFILEYKPSTYTTGAPSYVAFRIEIDAPGEYFIRAKANSLLDAPVPAVYFFRDGTEGVVNNAVSTYPADSKLGYYEIKKADGNYKTLGKINITEAGEYIISFVGDATSVERNSITEANGAQRFFLEGIQIVPTSEEEFSGISLTSDADIVYVGSDVALTTNEVWKIWGEKEMADLSNVCYESSDESVATVSDTGVVTALSSGEVTITASLKDSPSISATYTLTVYDPNASILGVSLDYVMGTIVMKDQTIYNPHNNRLDVSGNLRDLSYVDSYDEIDGSKTELWAYNNMASVTWKCLQKMYMSFATTVADYSKDPFFAVKVRVSNRGEFYFETEVSSVAHGSEADFHIIPAEGLNAVTAGSATRENYIGTADGTVSGVQRLGKVEIPTEGDYYVILKFHSDNPNLDENNRNMFYLKRFSLVAPPGDYEKVGMYIEGLSGDGDTLAYNSERDFTFAICDAAGVKLENVDYANDVTVNSIEMTKGAGEIADLIIENGRYTVVSYNTTGEAEIYANVTYDGITKETVLTFLVDDIGKTGRTIYYDDMIANARENIKKYSWARAEKDEVIKEADKYVSLGADYLWDMISGNGVPRAYNVALEISHPVRDPYEMYCRYCGKDLLGDHGNYPFIVNGITDPWKVKCPECSRRFPTNDFGKFYELGRTQENGGLFDRDTALEAHRALLIEKGLLSDEAIALASPGEEYSADWYLYYGYGVAGGYLHNDLYPEVGNANSGVKFATEDGLRNGDASAYATIVPETVERFGVDDGYGYNTGRVYTNGVKEYHAYVAYFNHFGVYFSDVYAGSLVAGALDYLGRAYLYTGDEKYGRLGAIILDRIADVYPDMSIRYWSTTGGRRYPNSTGGSPAGKDLGRIWASFSAERYAECYDIFYPMFADEEVVSFLSEKAEYYGMENDKKTSAKIRKNIEDGICREIFEAMKEAQIYANFGIHHSTLIKTAIALDDKEDTSEMLEWLYSASTTDAQSYNTGGDVNRKLLETVYRDGMVNESPTYNQMSVGNLCDAADILEKYVQNGGELGSLTLLEHPKYIKIITSYLPMVRLHRGVLTMSDCDNALNFPAFPYVSTLITSFNSIKNTDDPDRFEETLKMAQQLWLYGGEKLKDEHYDIFTKDPENIYGEVKALIDEYGEYNWDKSSIMTGYGLGFLRDGELHDTVGITGINDTTRDTVLNFSGHNLHNHADMLDMQLSAYGVPFTYDFGYAEFMVTGDPHSSQLTSTTIGHNTVVVDETNQTPSLNVNDVGVPQQPLHFDAKDTRVKVVDARTPTAYEQTDDYRRTLVMVNYDDEVSYTVDFFRVDGGNDHLYTFSPAADTRPTRSDNLTFVKQVDEPQDSWRYDHKNYYPTSSYAGPTVQYGQDPLKTPTSNYTELMYPHGYTWFYNVERADNPGTGEFWLDWEVKDFRGRSRNPNIGMNLRMTMLNGFDVDEVSLVNVPPQRIKVNDNIDHFEKVLIRRKGEDLDSLFTTVYEPYTGERYVTAIEQISIARSGGAEEGADDEAKAVKVALDDGRIDYIVYATNRDVIYTVTDGGYSFEFAGFVGVWTVNENGESIYSYLHDGTTLGEGEGKVETFEAAVTGTVVDFQKEFSLNNWIDIEFSRDMTDEEVADLVDRMIIPSREGNGTSAYLIEGIEKTGSNTARINLNSTSTVDGYVDMNDESKGYVYVLSGGESFEIPMSYEEDNAPVFDKVENQSVSAGNMISVKVAATPASDDLTVTYKARTLPRGAGFDEATATFSWKPTATQTGKNLVAIDAIDSAGRVSTLYFEIEVFGSTSGGGGGGMDVPSTDDKDDEPKEDEPTVDEPTVDEPTVDEPTEKGFVDLGNHAWAEDAINYLADEGIIKGTSDVTFAPANNITRADYAILLVRAFKLESEQTENFADVDASDYFAKELAVARNTGIVGGVGNNNYAPRNTITRQDMMVILYRALTKLGIELKAVEGIEAESYADYNDVADYAKEAVKALIEAGLVNGKSGLIAGNDKTTRAEVAVLLKRILDYIA